MQIYVDHTLLRELLISCSHGIIPKINNVPLNCRQVNPIPRCVFPPLPVLPTPTGLTYIKGSDPDPKIQKQPNNRNKAIGRSETGDSKPICWRFSPFRLFAEIERLLLPNHYCFSHHHSTPGSGADTYTMGSFFPFGNSAGIRTFEVASKIKMLITIIFRVFSFYCSL